MSIQELSTIPPGEDCQPKIKEIMENLKKDLNPSTIQSLLTNFFGQSFASSISDIFFKYLVETISSISDASKKVSCFQSLYDCVKDKNLQINNIKEAYATALSENNIYTKAAEIYSSLPIPANESDKLKYYLRIGELQYKAESIDEAFTSLNRANNYVFRAATEKTLLARFDTLRGQVHMKQGKYAESAKAFYQVFTQTHDINSLRCAAIAAILMPYKGEKRIILSTIEDVNESSQLDILFMVKLISEGHFIDKFARDSFVKAVGDQIEEGDINSLSSSCLEHNLVQARRIFRNITFDSMGVLLGESPDNIAETLKGMIQQKRIKNAVLDQPGRKVIFNEEEDQTNNDISLYCAKVESKGPVGISENDRF